MYLPPPRIELVGLLIEFVVEVYRPDVGENAPILRDEVPFDLNVLHRLAHDAADDVPHPQRLRYHLLYMYCSCYLPPLDLLNSKLLASVLEFGDTYMLCER